MALLSGVAPSTAEIIDLLREHGISSTLQRVEIARLFFTRPQHISADQTLDLVNNGKTVVSKATVYNTLSLFSRMGLVREIVADPTKVFYEPKNKYHHHYYDVDTQTLTDVDPNLVKIDSLPEPPDGATFLGVDVVIRISSRNHKQQLENSVSL